MSEIAAGKKLDGNGVGTAAGVPFRDALLFWLKLGFVSFGGPAGQISLMHQELVERRRWISERRFLHALNYCMLLPGPEAQQLATYIGWLMHRTWGGIVAGVLFVLPSLLILVILSWVYVAYGNTALVAGLFYGIKPAVTAVVVQAAWRIGSRTLKNWPLMAIALVALLAILLLGIPFPAIVAAAALTGWVGGRLGGQHFRVGGVSAASVGKPGAPALIDDDSPLPAHARFSWPRLGIIALIGALLWIVPVGLLVATLGWQHTLTQMSLFFTKAALLTFGGAYAVLPYVYQGAVEHFAWLTPTQMIDGLALGETTPGPLIMVVAYVGFVGAYAEGFFGPDALFLAGCAAAVLVTWFTFLPSFLFILAGGPLVERTHDVPQFTAPLVAVTAAVVGVIVNLALFFAYHVFWPTGFAGDFDIFSALIALLAAIALLRFKLGVIPVILGCAITGLLASL